MRNTMKKTLLKVLLTASVLSVSPVVAAESNVVYAAENDYILPDSDSRAYTYDELSDLSQDELRLAINEIYAKHGRIFDAADLQNYFNSKSWYNGTVSADDFSEDVFNTYEKSNVDLLSSIREGTATGSSGVHTAIDDAAAKKMLNGEIVELGPDYMLDLNQDGNEDGLHITVTKTEYQDTYTLTVGSESLTNKGENVKEDLYGVSLNGKDILIMVYEYGPSDDPLTTFFRYDGNTLKNIGQIATYPENMKVENGEIKTKTRCNIMGTAAIQTNWTVDDSGFMGEIPQNMYEYSLDFSYPGKSDDYSVYLKEYISVYSDMDENSEETVMEPQNARFHIYRFRKLGLCPGRNRTGWLALCSRLGYRRQI
ncbi:MAG: YARHG domain-containing protein [Blautia sp.]